MITFFVERLRCPHCGVESEFPMYTKLLDEPGTVMLRTGDAIDADPVNYRETFLELRPPSPGEPIRFFLPWLCRNCGWGNWALITVDKERVQAIEDTPLNQGTLPLAQYIDNNLGEYFATVTGEDLYEEDATGDLHLRKDFASVFLEHLPEPPGRAPSFKDFL